MTNKSAYIWGLFARFAPAVVQLATNMVFARMLSPNDFGVIGMLAVIFMVSNMLIDSGLGGSLVKEKNISKIDYSTITTFNVISGAIVYIVLFFAAPFIGKLLGVEAIDNIIRILSLTIICSSFAVVPKAILLRNLQFKTNFKISIISIILASIISICAALFGLGIYALVTYQLVNSIIGAILVNIYAKYKISFGFSWDSFKRLFSFGFFMSCVSVIDTIYENLLTTLTGKYVNVEQAGYLSQSKRLDDALSYSVSMTIGTVTFPIVTKLKDDLAAFNTETTSISKTIPLLVSPILMIVAAYADIVVTILYGEQWLRAGFYLSVLMFAGLFVVYDALYRGFIKALGQAAKLMLATLSKRIVGILILLFVIYISPAKLVFGYIFCAIIGCCINMSLFCSLSHKSLIREIKTIISNILPSIILFVIFYTLNYYIPSSIISIIIASILLVVYYFLFLRLYKIKLYETCINLINRRKA